MLLGKTLARFALHKNEAAPFLNKTKRNNTPPALRLGQPDG